MESVEDKDGNSMRQEGTTVNYRGYDLMMPVIMHGLKSAAMTKRHETQLEVDEIRCFPLEVTRRTISHTTTSEGRWKLTGCQTVKAGMVRSSETYG